VSSAPRLPFSVGFGSFRADFHPSSEPGRWDLYVSSRGRVMHTYRAIDPRRLDLAVGPTGRMLLAHSLRLLARAME